ncbi:MAG: DUF2726 domain-containing protein [Robiginitomaculum sp.]
MFELGIIIFIGLCVLWLALGARSPYAPPQTRAMPGGDARHYALAKSIFVNRSERAFFEALRAALGRSNCLLLTKVRMEDIVGVSPQVKDGPERWRLRGRVKSRHVDFLICAANGAPLMAIELDGSIHDKGKNNAMPVHYADDLKDRIFIACGLPLERVKTNANFTAAARAIAFQINLR